VREQPEAVDQMQSELDFALPTLAPDREAERIARTALRRQVAKLERELGATLTAAFPRLRLDPPAPAGDRGPRLMSLGELEDLRDDLDERLRAGRRALGERCAREEENRVLLERMMLEPQRHKFARLSLTELGEAGCGVWEVRPRLGLIGMLAGWWHVKLSSGCPLPGGAGGLHLSRAPTAGGHPCPLAIRALR
jgi:hypothetical protein